MAVQTNIRAFFSPVKRSSRSDGSTAATTSATTYATASTTSVTGTNRPWLSAAPDQASSGKRNTAFELVRSEQSLDLGAGSEILYYPRFLDPVQADEWLKALDKDLPWSRATFHIYGQDRLQPRKSVYVTERNLPTLRYSGQEPDVHFWEEYPVLGQILDAVRKLVPGIQFNSVLVNRYADGQDHVGWHSDDTKVFGPTPTIASVTLGAEREFLVRMKKHYMERLFKALTPPTHPERGKSGAISGGVQVPGRLEGESDEDDRQSGGGVNFRIEQGDVLESARAKCRLLNSGDRAFSSSARGCIQPLKEKYSFLLKHGSLLVMKGNMQRDWQHTVPKRSKVTGVRINLTFRVVVSEEQGRYLGQYRS